MVSGSDRELEPSGGRNGSRGGVVQLRSNPNDRKKNHTIEPRRCPPVTTVRLMPCRTTRAVRRVVVLAGAAVAALTIVPRRVGTGQCPDRAAHRDRPRDGQGGDRLRLAAGQDSEGQVPGGHQRLSGGRRRISGGDERVTLTELQPTPTSTATVGTPTSPAPGDVARVHRRLGTCGRRVVRRRIVAAGLGDRHRRHQRRAGRR